LKGNVHPLAQPRYDQGAVPDSFPAERMLLLLQRSPEWETALQQFLQDAHTLGSPSYHKWLKPEDFGKLYGPADSDVAVVTSWLESQGFIVARVTKGKTGIEFSGNAGQIRKAFNTEIHTYSINGEQHHANNRDPQIPAALAPVVAGITPINDFRPKPHIKVLGRALYDARTHVVKPQWTVTASALALAPGDFAVQYDLNPLYSAGTNGASVTIGIIGASNVDPTVIADYRSLFGLPPGTLKVIVDGNDPGPTPTQPAENWATGETYLDVEVSGAIAPGATINLYTAADTSVQPGLLLAAQRAVDDDQASILSTSYGDCEQDLGSAGNQFWASLWEQAAAQGQTSFVSAGDNGSAGCDDFNAGESAQLGLAVSGFASTPWNISVGGTDFYYSTYNGTQTAQAAQLATYWNLNPTNLPATSLLQPIPEQPWNRAFGLNLYDGGVYDPNAPTIVAGSGGASSCISGVSATDGSYASCKGGYSKPSWQSGKGVPADGVRDLPDISLFAADGENDSFYMVCWGTDECVQEGGGNYQISIVGGTSASSPAMAGIMALINQKYGAQGQANFILYPLAAQHPTAFHDIAIGSNNVPCVQGTPNCTLSTLSDNTNGLYTLGHYYANAGYDEATGLGSVDANLLLQYWNSLHFTPTNTSLDLSQTTFTHGTPINVSVAVTGNDGMPSGDVGLVTTASPAAANTSLNELTLQSGVASATVNNLPGGQYQLTANYTGDTVFAPSSSTAVALNVSPEASTVSLSGNYWSNASNSFVPLTNGGSYPYGTYMTIDAQPIGVNAPKSGVDGIASGAINFTDAASTGQVTSGAVNLNVKGVAEWQSSVAFPVSANSVSASYSGDASFNGSTSSMPLTFTVTKAPTSALLDAQPSLIALGSATTLSLGVQNPYSGPSWCLGAGCTFSFPFLAPPTGTVTFSLGSTVLGTAPLVSNVGDSGHAVATLLNVTSLPLGTDAVTASYSGDANYNSVTSSFNVVVGEPTTLSGSANPSTINRGEYTAITAAVTGLKGLAVPTGTVSFYDGNPNVSYNWSDIEPLKNGSATSIALAGSYFALGNATVYVSYSGDSIYGPAEVTVSFTVTQGNLPPFTLSATPVVIGAPGATAGNTSTVTVTPMNGFVGAVYLSCALASYPNGAQYLPSCSIPSSVNITGTSAVTAAMAVNSTVATSSTIVSFFPIWPLPNGQGQLAASAGAMIAALFIAGVFFQRRSWRRLAMVLFILPILGGFTGCGRGGSTGGGGGGGSSGTTPGAYTFTVNSSFTANGVSQAQTTVTVTIQ
jgi:subtilase family serine protease